MSSEELLFNRTYGNKCVNQRRDGRPPARPEKKSASRILTLSDLTIVSTSSSPKPQRRRSSVSDMQRHFFRDPLHHQPPDQAPGPHQQYARPRGKGLLYVDTALCMRGRMDEGGSVLVHVHVTTATTSHILLVVTRTQKYVRTVQALYCSDPQSGYGYLLVPESWYGQDLDSFFRAGGRYQLSSDMHVDWLNEYMMEVRPILEVLCT